MKILIGVVIFLLICFWGYKLKNKSKKDSKEENQDIYPLF